MRKMTRVIVETPYAGDVTTNLIYARKCMEECLRRNEAPMLSHLLYTQALDDNIPEERQLGIDAGHAWLAAVEAVVVYTDIGISDGMKLGIARAEARGLPIVYRKLGGEKWQH